MDQKTDELLQRLETSPTDLRKLVLTVERQSQSAIWVTPVTIARWERDDPRAWAAVREWLTSRGIELVVLEGR